MQMCARVGVHVCTCVQHGLQVQSLAKSSQKREDKYTKWIEHGVSDRQMILDKFYQRTLESYFHRTGFSVCRCKGQRHQKDDADCSTVISSTQNEWKRLRQIFKRLMQNSVSVECVEFVARLNQFIPNKPSSFWMLLAKSLDVSGGQTHKNAQ